MARGGALLDNIPEMVTISDRLGRITYANPATERVSGYTPEEFASLHPTKRIHPDDLSRCEEAFGELLHTPGLSLELEHRAKHKDGTWRWVEVTLQSLFDDPEVGGLLATVRDVTGRKRAETALAASEEQYRTLFASIDEGFCTIEVLFDERGDPVDYRFLRMNPAFERQTGFVNAAGRTARELVPEHEEFWYEVFGRIARTGEAMRFEHEAAALGRYYDVYAFRVDELEKNRVAVIFKDVLARKRAEEEQERLRSLEASARAEAAERERIGRELHDRVAHTMAVAHQSLQLHGALADRDPVRAAETLKRAAEATRTALDQTRHLSSQLARQNTEETRYGLSAALRGLLETHVPEGVEADLSVSGDDQVVSPRAAEEAYLVMREAVRNAVAHSGCGRIDVGLEIDDAELKGHVRDDGTGFDRLESTNRVRGDQEDDGYAEGVGLRSMKERTGQLGGRLEVHSEPGVGTTVEVRVPLVG